MSLVEAINSLSVMKSTFASLEKLEAILKLANGLDTYVHEQELLKHNLEVAVSTKRDQLAELDRKLASMEAHLERRTAEIAAELKGHQDKANEKKVELDLDLDEHAQKHEAAVSEVNRTTNLRVTELNQQIVEKQAELNLLEKRVSEMRSMAKAIASGE
ncbi:MAG: hypothetical protein C5B59_17275 [Bacteroidetes bacterium]|nr:MAG: hypothetical protein C5B59_17275 [Bacteroidota bacterium]